MLLSMVETCSDTRESRQMTSEDGKVDKKWFLNRLQEQKKSVRGLARHLEIDASAASRMLSGQRKMQIEEAHSIARFLNAPVSEVMRHAGVAKDIDGLPTRILLAALIDENGKVQRLQDPKPLPQSVIERLHAAIAGEGNGKIIAAQVRASKGPLALWDDAVILFGPTDQVDLDAIGSLSICRKMDGEQLLVRVERARKTGEATIRNASDTQSEVLLDTAARVIAVIP